MAGVAILVYDHHQRELAQKVTSIQQRHYAQIISSLTVWM
ncbi:MAG TPA: hypothetical protein ENI06_07310 [Spirochaetales bacterium]|nr:hypothetical protein [Spirochaetales bacterium]